MLEPIFRPENGAAQARLDDTSSDAPQRSRDKALLWRAVTLSIESAFSSGQDLPVGAVAASGSNIVGRYFASDNRTGIAQLHAETMAILDAQMNRMTADTIVASMEPCTQCQDFLATHPTIRRVGFGISRHEVAERGLVRPSKENVFQRALRLGLPYEVIQIEEPTLHTVATTVLDFTSRDLASGQTTVDAAGLQHALKALSV